MSQSDKDQETLEEVMPEEEIEVPDVTELDEYLEEEEEDADEPASLGIRFVVMLFTILPGALAAQAVSINVLVTGVFDVAFTIALGALAAVLTLVMWITLFFRALQHATRGKFVFTTDYTLTGPKARRKLFKSTRTIVVPAVKGIEKTYRRINMGELFHTVDGTIKRMAQEGVVYTRRLQERGFEVHPREVPVGGPPDTQLKEEIQPTLISTMKLGWHKMVAAVILTVLVFCTGGLWPLWMPAVTLFWWMGLFTFTGRVLLLFGLAMLAVVLGLIVFVWWLRRKFKKPRFEEIPASNKGGRTHDKGKAQVNAKKGHT